MRVFEAKCSAAERDLPLGAVQQLFTGLRGEHLPGIGDTPPQEELFSVFGALHRTIRTVCAEEAVLLAIDDIDLCDRQSIQWLGYLARRLSGMRVLLTVTSVPDAAGAYSGAPGLAGLLDHPRCQRVILTPLTTAGIGELLRSEGRQDAVAGGLPGALRAVTGGNPRLVRELLGHLPRAEGSDVPSVEELSGQARQYRARLTNARICREPAETQALARAAAVTGEGASPEFMAVVANLDEPDVATAIRTLERIGALRSGSCGITFADGAVRMALEAEVSAADRSALRLRAARLSHEAGSGNEQVARYLLHIANPAAEPWVVPSLRAAAGDALRRGAPEDAAAYLRCALRQPDSGAIRQHLLTELGRVLLYRDPAVASRYLSEAIATIDDPMWRGKVAASLSTAHLLCGRLGAAVDVLVEIGTALRSTAVTDPTALACTEIDAQLQVQYTLARALGAAHQTSSVVDFEGDASPGVISSKAAAGQDVWRLGILALRSALAGHSAARTRALAVQALRSGLAVREGSAELAFFVALSLLYADSAQEAERAFDEIERGAERSGARILQAATTLGRSLIHQNRGEVREALNTAGIAMSEFFELPPSCFRGSAAAHMITLLLDSARLEEAEELAHRTAACGGDGDMDGWDTAVLNLALGRLRAARGDISGALVPVLDCGRRLERQGVVNPAMLTWRSDAALLHSALGERDRAVRLAQEEMQLAERWESPRAIGRALRALGVATGGEDGRRMLAAGVTHLEGAGAPLELAGTLIDLGVSDTAAGDLAQGRARLRRAVELARRCGAALLVELASVELAKTGARPRKAGSDRWSSLTPGELQVARLAATGARNREIAAKLHVTSRAVERHLTSAYRKLGVSGRVALSEIFV